LDHEEMYKITIKDITEYLTKKGVKTILLFDFTCGAFTDAKTEYRIRNERQARSIRRSWLKKPKRRSDVLKTENVNKPGVIKTENVNKPGVIKWLSSLFSQTRKNKKKMAINKTKNAREEKMAINRGIIKTESAKF